MLIGDSVPSALRSLAAQAELVLKARGALELATVTGVDRGVHAVLSPNTLRSLPKNVPGDHFGQRVKQVALEIRHGSFWGDESSTGILQNPRGLA